MDKNIGLFLYFRSLSGLILKNNVKAHMNTLPPQVLYFIKAMHLITLDCQTTWIMFCFCVL